MENSPKHKRRSILPYFLDTKHLPATIIAAVIATVIASFLLKKPFADPPLPSTQNINISSPDTSQAHRGRSSNSPVTRPVSISHPPALQHTGKQNHEIAVMAENAGTLDGNISKKLADWLRSSGLAAYPVFGEPNLRRQDFDGILKGDITAIQRSAAASAAGYICLLHYDSENIPSLIDNGLVVVKLTANLSLIDTRTGSVVDNIRHTEKSSGESQDKARQRVEDDMVAYFTAQSLNLNK